MTRHHSSVGAAALVASALLLSPAPARAQSIASRVAAAPDGEVRLAYATRSGVCGDGQNVVAVADALMIYPSMESYGTWSGVRCVPGPAQVTLTVRAHRVESVRTRVGATASGGGTDLGTVSAPQAAQYFLDLARTLDGRDARNALLPAAIADSVDVSTPMVRLAADTTVAVQTRRRAAHWAGMLGGPAIVAPLERITRDADDQVAEGAMFGLTRVADGAGVPALVGIARTGAPDRRREKAVFWLGQSGRDDALRVVREVAEDRAAPERVRGMAIFSLGQTDKHATSQGGYLRTLFPKLESDALREKVLQAVSEDAGAEESRWLLGIARDASESEHVRKQAVFWAGQGGTPTRDIAALYDGLGANDNQAVKEHTIFALSQRDDDAATAKLLDIARVDPDRAMRRKALFWLAQKNDPRVTKLITDLVTRE